MIDGLKKVVFFGAHTDDEMICAGTLHRLVRQGCEVYMCAFSFAATEKDRKGYGSHEEEPSKGKFKSVCDWEIVGDEWDLSKKLIGGKGPCKGLSPSCDFHKHRQEIADYVFKYCEQERPDALITLSPEDENPAHKIVGEECERVSRGRVPLHLRCQFPWNFSIGRSNLFVKLEQEDLQCKQDVIDAYQSQKFRYNYHDMLIAQCRADGLSVKAQFAEKFEIVRAVV